MTDQPWRRIDFFLFHKIFLANSLFSLQCLHHKAVTSSLTNNWKGDDLLCVSHQVKVVRQRTDKLIRQSNYIPWSSVIRMSVPHVSDWCPFNPQSQITSHRNNKKSCCCINISVWLWVLKKQGNFLNSIPTVYSSFRFFADGLDRCGFRLEAVGGSHCEIWQV